MHAPDDVHARVLYARALPITAVPVDIDRLEEGDDHRTRRQPAKDRPRSARQALACAARGLDPGTSSGAPSSGCRAAARLAAWLIFPKN